MREGEGEKRGWEKDWGGGDEGREREGLGKGRKSDTFRYCDLHD